VLALQFGACEQRLASDMAATHTQASNLTCKTKWRMQANSQQRSQRVQICDLCDHAGAPEAMDEDPTGLKAEGGDDDEDRQKSLSLKIKVPTMQHPPLLLGLVRRWQGGGSGAACCAGMPSCAAGYLAAWRPDCAKTGLTDGCTGCLLTSCL